MAVINVIKFDGYPNGRQWLVYKHCSENIVLGSQLIVNQGQEALFYKGGEALDLFSPGTHTLSTGNLPILNKVVNLPFGNKTPFSAEVYYINKTSNLDMKWGTSNPIPLEDPKYKLLLNIRSHGQYGITISNSRLFLSKIIGALPNGAIANPILICQYFNGLINTKIKTVLSSYVIKNNISFLEISQYLDVLSKEFQKAIHEEFDRFGIEITNFYCEDISPSREEYEKLRQYKEELSLGDDFYKQRRQFDIMEKLAENPSSGGMANAGIGLGMGFGLIGQFDNAFNNIGQNMDTSTPKEGVVCQNCGTKNNQNAKFCIECGGKLSNFAVCRNCGAEIKNGMKFCSQCGTALLINKCSECGFVNETNTKYCVNCGNKL